ncbi:MAG TPA: MBL fold metallo-hydrolase [Acidimicrobiales bacterium]|nr:MBL fold metallo-hydrolase [Acidimicrobiales bacterium]
MTGEKRTYAKQEQEPATDEITELAPGVLRTQLPVELPGLGHVNCYLLEDERGVALVDPGLPGPESWNALLDRLGRAGFELRHVHTAVITHSHFDHFGGASQLRAEAEADILTHESFRLVLEQREMLENPDSESLQMSGEEDLERLRDMFRRPKPWGGHWKPPPDDELRLFARLGRRTRRFLLPKPSITVADRHVIKLARREWIAIHTPGHTTDHLCLYDPVEKLFISGDHVLPTITPHIAGAGPTGDADQPDPLARFFMSLQRMHDFDVELVLPAHGHPFTDLAGRADQIIHHHEDRLDVLREAAADLPSGTVSDYMRRLFRERSWGDMAESETYAHLEHLRLLGEADISDRDGYLIYQLTA